MSITVELNGIRQTFAGDEVLLGSDRNCDIRVDHAGVRPKHAVLRQVGGRWMVEARDGHEVQVDDGAWQRLTWLKPGQAIRLAAESPAFTFEPTESVRSVGITASADVAESAIESEDGANSASVPATFESSSPNKSRDRSSQVFVPTGTQPLAQPTNDPSKQLLLAGVIGAIVVLSGVVIGLMMGRQSSPAPVVGANPDVASHVAVPRTTETPPSDIAIAPKPGNKNDIPTPLPKPNHVIVAPEARRPAMVWIGLQRNESLFLYASGWAVKPNLVVTTGEAVAHLQEVLRNGNGIKVFVQQQTERRIVIEGKMHPSYVADAPGETRSMLHNIGVLRIEAALPQVLSVDDSDAVTALKKDDLVRALGTYCPGKDAVESPIDTLELKAETWSGTIAGSLRTTDPKTPLLKLALNAPRPSAGSVVLDAHGSVVGILAASANEMSLVPITSLSALVP